MAYGSHESGRRAEGSGSSAVDEVGAAGLEPVEPPAEGGPHLALHGIRLVPRHPPPLCRLRVAGPPRPRRRGGRGPAPPPRFQPRRAVGPVLHPSALVESRGIDSKVCLAGFCVA